MLEKIRYYWRKIIGYHHCQACHQQTLLWIQDPVIFDDEPPLMGHWQCFNKDCLKRTPTQSTPWADKIAQQYGYETYLEALQAGLRRLKKPR